MNTNKRASSTDVARHAGVSQSAVSRAFSPGGIISEQLRTRVREAAAELGYRPNALVSSLITKRTNMVALMTGDIANPHYARTINAFSLGLQERGLHVLLFSLIEGQSVENAVEEVLKYRVDGVIVISAQLSAEVGEACHQVGVPVVLYNRYIKQPNVCSVRIENADGGRQIADLLIDEGHERLGFIAGTRVDPTSADRENGFTLRVAERGAKIVARAEGRFDFASGREMFADIWRERPTALFCASDLMAIGAIEAARHDFGLRVPQDIAIAGFDDLPEAAWPSYDLTTIRQPVEAMVEVALELLTARMASANATTRTVLIPGEPIIRGSTLTKAR